MIWKKWNREELIGVWEVWINHCRPVIVQKKSVPALPEIGQKINPRLDFTGKSKRRGKGNFFFENRYRERKRKKWGYADLDINRDIIPFDK